MKFTKNIDKLTSFIMTAMMIVCIAIIVGLINMNGEGSTLIEVGMYMVALSIGYVIAAINASEKTRSEADKFSFDIMLLFLSFLIVVCAVEDYLYVIGQDVIADWMELGETMVDVFLSYVIWRYIASCINISVARYKKIDILQIALTVAMVIVLFLVGFIIT